MSEFGIVCIILKIPIYFFRSSVSEAKQPHESEDVIPDESMKKYKVDKTYADRRYKVQSARTYFYLNEATCERNMEIFIKCLEAVSGE